MRVIAFLTVLGMGEAAWGQIPVRSLCADRHTVPGIDVSKWQGDVDWDRVARTGYRFAFIRASDGATIRDEKFDRNWKEAKRVGMLRGAYQFFRPNQDPVAQADLLLEMMGPLHEGDLPPVLDFEVAGEGGVKESLEKIEVWVERVEQATGVEPILYTNAKTWVLLAANSRQWADHPLWIAHHDVECPVTPTAWKRWAFHQHSDRAKVDGIKGRADLNKFNGTLQQLRRLTVRDAAKARRKWLGWKRVQARPASP